MQKALTEMNVRLDSVISDIMGKTGERILRAIVAGERDLERLTSFRDSRLKASVDTLAASLQGTWRDEHLFALEQAMQRYDFLELQIEACEARIMAEIEQLTPTDDPPDGGTPDDAPQGSGAGTKTSSNTAGKMLPAQEKAMAQALREMMGVDLTAIPTIGGTTALVIASEIGPDFSAFPSAQHFCSWLGVAPGTRISGANPCRADRTRRSIGLDKLCACQPCRHATARRSSAPSTGRVSPEWIRPSRSPPLHGNLPA